MIVECIVVCLLAKLKGFKLKYLFRSWTFYPILVVQGALVFLQMSIFMRNYAFVHLVPYVQMSVVFSFLFAMFTFELYRPAIIGSASIGIGTVLNRLVIAQNGGHMPVFPTLSYLTGYVTPAMLESLDTLHVAGTASSKLIFLTDVIDYGYSILSLGDVLIHMFACIMLYTLIKAVNKRYAPQAA